MPYNSNRRVNTPLANQPSRTVSYNSGGLNERFSKIVNTQKTTNTPTNTTRPTGPTGPTSASVFSRLRGAKPVRVAKSSSNIQSRLGKIGGGIKKNQKPVTPVRKRVVAKKPIAKKGVPQKKKVVKKPATAQDLDKSLDDYMMKDPKTMQARLDADITSYMAEAEDILMDENL